MQTSWPGPVWPGLVRIVAFAATLSLMNVFSCIGVGVGVSVAGVVRVAVGVARCHLSASRPGR